MDTNIKGTTAFKENFAVESKLEAFYTGGRVELTENGQHLFCSCDGCIKIVESSTGKVTKTIEIDEDAILKFILSPDNKVLITYSKSGLFKEWEWETATVTRTWKSTHKGPINCMAFDDTGFLLATGGTDSRVVVWDIQRRYCTHNLRGGLGVFNTLKYHEFNDELLVFGTCDDYQIHIWNLNLSNHVGALKGHFSSVTSIVFTEDKAKMLSASRDQVVILWDLITYETIRKIPVFEAVESLFLLPRGRQLPAIGVVEDVIHFITAGNKGMLRVWQTNGKTVFRQENALDITKDSDGGLVISQAIYNKALDIVMIVTYEHNILTYKLEDLSLHKQLVGFNDDVLQVVFLGKDTHFAIATNSHHIKVFEMTTFNCQILKGHTDIVLSLDVFPNHPFLMASCSKDNCIRIWKMCETTATFQCVALGVGHTHGVGAIACSRLNAKFVVSGSKDTCLKLWEVPQNITTPSLTLDKPYSLGVWSTTIAHEKEINAVCISPNDKLIATGSQDKSIKLWTSSPIKFVSTLRGHRRGVWCVQFSPVDRVVASGSADGTIKIWSLSDFTCVKTFEGHECSVLNLVFVSRGMQILSGATDGLIKLWTIKLNECIKTFDEHNGKVWSLKIDKDESRMISGGGDSTIVIWKDCTELEKEEELQKQEQLVLQGQELTNLLLNKKYAKALGLTITLNQPFRALTILKEILMLPDGEEQLEKTFNKLREDQVDAIITFAVSWNQNSKHCHEAQKIVNLTLKRFTLEELLTFPTMKANLQGLLPYTERHLQRLNRLLQQASFVEYMWKTIKISD